MELPSQRKFTWAVTVTHTEKGVLGMASKKKWEKNQTIIKELGEMLYTDTKFHRLILYPIQVFLIYVARTHRDFNPYTKGINLII